MSDSFQPDAPTDSFREDAPKTWTDQLGDFGTHAWNMLSGTASAIAHPIDTAKAILNNTSSELSKAKDAYDSGDTGKALAHLKNAVPVLGPISKQMQEEGDRGDLGAEAGDLVGFMAAGKIGEAVPRVPGAVGRGVTATTEALSQPGMGKLASGASQGAGAAVAAAAGHPFVAADLGIRAAKALKEGIAARNAAAQPPVANPGVQVGAPAALSVDQMRIPQPPEQLGPIPPARTPAAAAPQPVAPVEDMALLNQAAKANGFAKDFAHLTDAGKALIRKAVQQDAAAQAAKAPTPDVAPSETPAAPESSPEPIGLYRGTPQIGATRGNETLQMVPIDKISGDPGNQIHMDTVADYQKNGYTEAAQLRADPDNEGRYIINEGHHRILADVREGATEVPAWVPNKAATEATLNIEDQQAETIKALVNPSLTDALRDVPVASRTEAAAANYRAGQEGAPSVDPAQMYQAKGRLNKSAAVAQSILDEGLSHADLSRLTPAKLQQALAQRAVKLGINTTGQYSMDSVAETMFQLRKLEDAKQ